MRHVIWDWNGTLLDDLPVVVASVSETIVEFGADPIDADDYRRHYTRPVRSFYEVLFGRSVSDTEWETLDRRFHEIYRERLGHVPLAGDARHAVECAAASGATQSLLSMFIHDELVRLVDDHGLADYFVRVDGLRGMAGVSKHDSMGDHLAALLAHPGVPDDAGLYVVVGDALDDAVAAAAHGVACVLYDSGSHHPEALRATGYPVARTLLEALELAGVRCPPARPPAQM